VPASLTGTSTVLVVDDDPDIVEICSLHLRKAGYEVITAIDGLGAVATASAKPPSAIVLDCMLPDVDGIEVLRQLKSDPRTADIPVIMLTARTREQDRASAWEAGVSDYLTKPFDAATLVSTVNGVCQDGGIDLVRQRGSVAAPRGRAARPGREGPAVVPPLVRDALDAVVVVSVDGDIESWNAAATDRFGWAAAEVLGSPVTFLAPPAIGAQLLAAIADTASGRRLEPFDLVLQDRAENALRTSVSVSPVHDDDARVTAVSLILRDLSERTQVEERFRRLVEAAPDALLIVDADGRIDLVNRQTEILFGYSRERLVGQPIEVLVPHRLRDRHPSYRRAYADQPMVREMGAGFELFALRADGTEFPVEISLSPLETEHGVAVSASIRDVTDRKRAEEQALAWEREREDAERLREVDKLRSDFLSTVSHELRTPLTSIKGYAEWLVGEWDEVPDDRRYEFVGRILRAGGRLDALIGDLLDFTRMERGQLNFDLIPHPLLDMVTETVDNLSSLLSGHNVQVAVGEDLTVLVDRSAFIRVLENLLSNAAKFSPPGSVIAVTGQATDASVRLSVSDQGPGIKADERDRVFDRFYRVPDVAARHAGTGIGLAIVKQFIEAQGGRVTLESQPGSGSTFTLSLQAADG
jgi:PAS domain S-box-containing protein